MTYATPEDVAAGFRTLTDDEEETAEVLLEEAALMIDSIAKNAPDDAKRVVSCRIVRRAMGSADDMIPIGATQGSMSALGYSQSWQMGGGGASTGELYIGKTERMLLGLTGRMGVTSVYGRGGGCHDCRA